MLLAVSDFSSVPSYAALSITCGQKQEQRKTDQPSWPGSQQEKTASPSYPLCPPQKKKQGISVEKAAM